MPQVCPECYSLTKLSLCSNVQSPKKLLFLDLTSDHFKNGIYICDDFSHICVGDFDLNESRTIDLPSRDLKANYFKDFTWQWICIYVTWQCLCSCVTWQRLCICMVVSLSYNLLQNKNKNKARHPGMCCFHGSSSITLSAELGYLFLFAPGHQSFMPLVFGSDSHQLWSWDLEVQHLTSSVWCC